MSRATGGSDEPDRIQLGRRLREAREYVGLSQEEVAFALSISRPAVVHIESGSRKVEAFELNKLSELYGRTVDYLLTGNAPADETRVAFLARATKGMSDSDIDELARFAAFFEEFAKIQEARFMKTDDDALMAAARRATEVLEEFEAKKRIEAGYTRIDAEHIASASDVVVIYRKLERLLGGFLLEEGTPGILVNWDRPRGLVHMTCAHELGHFALGHESTSDTTVDISKNAALVERTANQFAYALLAPSWLVAQTMRRQRWGRDSLRNPLVVYQMSLRLGMSFKAMVWSLNRLGHLTVSEALGIVDVQPITLKRDILEGAAPSNSRSDVWMLTDADRDRVLEPGLGDHMVFDLPNHAGSGRLWSVDEARSEGFLLKPFVRDARNVPVRRGAEINVGGDGLKLRYELTTPLELISAGSDGRDVVQTLGPKKRTISLSERAPWQPEQTASDQLILFAEFERLEDGLPKPERDRRLARTRRA